MCIYIFVYCWYSLLYLCYIEIKCQRVAAPLNFVSRTMINSPLAPGSEPRTCSWSTCPALSNQMASTRAEHWQVSIHDMSQSQLCFGLYIWQMALRPCWAWNYWFLVFVIQFMSNLCPMRIVWDPTYIQCISKNIQLYPAPVWPGAGAGRTGASGPGRAGQAAPSGHHFYRTTPKLEGQPRKRLDSLQIDRIQLKRGLFL